MTQAAQVFIARRQLIATCLAGTIYAALPTSARSSVSIADKVADILGSSKRLTYLQAKVALDGLIGGHLQLPSPVIEKLVLAIRQMTDANLDDKHKLAAIRQAIYVAGPWNDHRAFSYDLSDPYGEKDSNKLLATFLRTRRGNCVSMPILFLILAERMGVNVALSTAPLHIFARYTDATGRKFNIECTDGAHVMRDDWYRQKTPMTDRAIQSGLYMTTLTRTEAMAIMASTVVEFCIEKGRYKDAMDVADVVLKHNPRDALTMAHKGTAAAHIIRAEFEEKYPDSRQIPAAILPRYHELVDINKRTFAAAEALGWEAVK